MVSLAAIRSWPPLRELVSKSWASPLRIRFMAGSICLKRISPSVVSCTFFVLRRNRFCPSFFSRVFTDWLTADWEINNALEASEKLKVFAT